jgi:hypothetical protein
MAGGASRVGFIDADKARLGQHGGVSSG